MYKPFLVLVLVFHGLQLTAQQAVSGFVNFDDFNTWKPKIYLSQVALSDVENNSKTKPIAIADIQKDGFFKFDKKHFSDSNKIYRLHVERIRQIVNDTVAKKVTFMLSANDKIEFKKGVKIFGDYSTSNQADKEWQKLKDFESKLIHQYLTQEETVKPRTGFVKDSLQILLVKLVGIKELERKQLLDKDISENEEYYLNLLSELQSSDLNPSTYAFLERKLAYLTNVDLERKLTQSRWLNFGLGFLILLFGIAIAKMRRKRYKVLVSELSKQERTIRNLILQGKSNKEIANELFISLSTVKTHITSIYSKLNVANRKELLQKSTGTST
ncbi:response regulator transcription factor [Flagellimonas sp.]|uniref:response regulator transcription factor n=1 Tax=Flagellimonas sp. TaxID=2058762 RepID=UPI003B50323F